MSKKKSSSRDLNISGGKGDAPRSCFSKQFRDNFDAIDWGHGVDGVKWVEENGEVLSWHPWTKKNDDALRAFCDKIETEL